MKERGINMRIALFCIIAERAKHTHAQRSFLFSAERHKTSANGTWVKRLVGGTTGHPTNPTLSTTLLPRATPLSRVSCATPTSFPGFLLHVPTERKRETGGRENLGTRLVQPQWLPSSETQERSVGSVGIFADNSSRRKLSYMSQTGTANSRDGR